MDDVEQQIREAAYQTWNAEGRPTGPALAVWMETHRLVQGLPKGAVSPTPPSAGPHAQPELTNEGATPGTGMLPPAGAEEDPNSGPTG